jgi:hypothetical protein
MSRPGRIILLILALILLAFIAWLAYLFFGPLPSSPTSATTASSTSATTSTALSPDETAVSAVATAFGAEEQLVSLLAPSASTTIATDYGPYVTPSLLATWEADPQSAPGRVVSSPWPDHITVGSIMQTSTGYEVTGTLVLMASDSVTNGGNSGTDPVKIDLVNQNGKWLISKYQDLSQG